MEVRKGQPKYILRKHNNENDELLNPVQIITLDEHNESKDDISSIDNSVFEVPGYTKDELVEEIELLKSSSGCGSLYEYKQKIANKEINNFSHAQIKIWEELERNLQELEENN